MYTTTLNNGVEMPLLGYGVFQITDEERCRRSVAEALRCGYRLIDTAACYGNERAVGRAVAESGIARDDVFLTSKVWIQDAGYDATLRSFGKTLENLGTDHLDLYLIHMPYGDYHGSWRAMERLLREGAARAIGVCNFLPDRFENLVLTHEVAPAVNQMETHPFCRQSALRDLMAGYGTKLMAWAPFAEGRRGVFRDPTLCAIGERYGKTAAQVMLRWLNQSGVIAIPKSVHAERIRENRDIDDFELTPEDMARIDAMDEGRGLILDVASLSEARRLHGIRFVQ